MTMAGSMFAAELESAATEILQRRCLSCHNAKVKTAGLDLSTRGVVPLRLLLERVDKGQMPPSGPLSADEKATLRAWIDAGAPWTSVIAERRAGTDWWSLQPLRSEVAPGIDRWIDAGLKKAGLRSTPRADRRKLIRRLSFDLLGLPPTPEAVEAFVRDRRPDAWERLIDGMLASPHYGERWARHWLDVARYAESEGFERDSLREHVWKYRDYVIKSLNEDKPYAQFAREQIAGDALPDATHDSMIATALLTMGPTDAVGLTSAVESEREAVREDMLEESLSVVSQTFLGLTVNCARCHDHKFDPIPQRDYYRMRSALASVWPPIGVDDSHIDVQPNTLPLLTASERREREKTLEPIRNRIRELEERIARAYRAVRPETEPAIPAPFARWTFDVDARDEIGTMHGPEPRPEAGTISTAPLTKEIREKTLEAWVRVLKAPERSTVLFQLRNLSGYRGASVDGIEWLGGKAKRWENTSIGRFRSAEIKGAAAEDTPAGGRIHIAIVYRGDDSIQIYRNGAPYGEAYVPERGTPAAHLQTYFPGDAIARFNSTAELLLEEARLYDRALTDAQMAASFAQGVANYGREELRARMADVTELFSLEAALSEERAKRAAIATPEAGWFAAVRPAAPTRLLGRGDVTKKGEVVAPGGVAAIKGLRADFDLHADAADGDKRRKLADWITSNDNPLFWRVMVNRVWHHHFGGGLVENPNDFGYNGGLPSHPELLDWLAVEFRSSGGSLKTLHKTILLSEAYQRASTFDAAAAAKDADNRLLWRFTPRRLQGEAVRDAMLAVSGALNPKLHGASFKPFVTSNTNGSFRIYRLQEKCDEEQNRRTIYRASVATAGSPMLEALDCPLPAVKMPKRAATTTALQALSLMNSGFVQEQAKTFAARLAREASGIDAQVNLAFAIALGRAPQDWETRESAALAREHGLQTLCWGLLNMSEFLYVE